MSVTVEQLKEYAAKARQTVERRRVERDMLLRRHHTVKARAEAARAKADRIEAVKVLFEETGAMARAVAKEQAEDLLTQALQSTFGKNVAFKVEMGVSRDRPDASFKIVSAEGETVHEGEPVSTDGGGLVDVLSIGLRLLLMESAQPRIDGPLLLDEPFKQLSKGYMPACGAFLLSLCRDFERQVILVTHEQELAELADKSFLVTMEKGISIVTEQESGA